MLRRVFEDLLGFFWDSQILVCVIVIAVRLQVETLLIFCAAGVRWAGVMVLQICVWCVASIVTRIHSVMYLVILGMFLGQLFSTVSGILTVSSFTKSDRAAFPGEIGMSGST